MRESRDAERRNVEKREPNATSRRATCDSCIDGSIGTLKTQANLNVPIRIHRQFFRKSHIRNVGSILNKNKYLIFFFPIQRSDSLFFLQLSSHANRNVAFRSGFQRPDVSICKTVATCPPNSATPQLRSARPARARTTGQLPG